MNPISMDHKGNGTVHEEAVRRRYSQGAQQTVAELCCPVTYNPEYLKIIPQEILDRDYGCGDPTAYLQPGDVVLDLGSGGGKACYIAAQVVGPEGRVIGVDCNAEMLALARKYQHEVAERIGYHNVTFRAGMIQDLKLDLDLLSAELADHPVCDQQSWLELRNLEERLRREQTMIADESVDCVVSNCVLNLVRPHDREALFAEIFRVLKRGGRAVISDIVSDEDVPAAMREDPELWSGCISGAYREDEFLRAFERAGFHGIELVKCESEPWQTVEGIEFRSVTVRACKGKQGPCLERHQALIYKGPFKQVVDDDGHVYLRGERMAVCDKTYHLLQRPPYTGLFEPVAPRVEIPLEKAEPFACRGNARRSPRETKGPGYRETTAGKDCCGPGEPCC